MPVALTAFEGRFTILKSIEVTYNVYEYKKDIGVSCSHIGNDFIFCSYFRGAGYENVRHEIKNVFEEEHYYMENTGDIT